MSDLDLCDILARHQDHRGQWGNGSCTSRFGGPKHCLAYLLASDLVASELKVERARALPSYVDEDRSAWVDANDLRTALADQPEQTS